MALNGRLEELNLLEILQIVAFSKKTGTLRVEGAMARGAVLFREGIIVCAFSTATVPRLRAFAGIELGESERLVLRDQFRLALRELVGLREGHFEF